MAESWPATAACWRRCPCTLPGPGSPSHGSPDTNRLVSSHWTPLPAPGPWGNHWQRGERPTKGLITTIKNRWIELTWSPLSSNWIAPQVMRPVTTRTYKNIQLQPEMIAVIWRHDIEQIQPERRGLSWWDTHRYTEAPIEIRYIWIIGSELDPKELQDDFWFQCSGKKRDCVRSICEEKCFPVVSFFKVFGRKLWPFWCSVRREHKVNINNFILAIGQAWRSADFVTSQLNKSLETCWTWKTVMAARSERRTSAQDRRSPCTSGKVCSSASCAEPHGLQCYEKKTRQDVETQADQAERRKWKREKDV